MSKAIRDKVVKESLVDLSQLMSNIAENKSSVAKKLLAEAIADEITKDKEAEDDEDKAKGSEVIDVEDTVEDGEGASEKDEKEDDDVESESETEESEESVEDDEEGDKWSEFEKYRLSDDEYDMTGASDEDIVKVWKAVGKDDHFNVVDRGDGSVQISDGETGAEYIIDKGADNPDEENKNLDMKKSTKINETELDCFTTDYTDSPMSGLKMDNAKKPGYRDIDAGAPKGTEKPFSGFKPAEPFTETEDTDLEEEVIYEITADEKEDGDEKEEELLLDDELEESSTRTSRNLRGKSRKPAHVKKSGRHIPCGSQEIGSTNEEILNKVEAIVKENRELKKCLLHFKKGLKEAAVTQLNLGQVVKLMVENTTSKEEKQYIIKRFANEAKTTEQSNMLYESISNELKKGSSTVKGNLDEAVNKQFISEASTAETEVYTNDEIMHTLDLMHRMGC